uniref:hypothetical protein n=1 Tax=Alloprevotella sp. TaxID=1872471 RepID=UPI003FF02125
VGFLAVFGRHNIRPPHFASKVSYSASPQAFAACSRSAPCSGAATAIFFGQKLRKEFSFILNTLPFRDAGASLSTLIVSILNARPLPHFSLQYPG